MNLAQLVPTSRRGRVVVRTLVGCTLVGTIAVAGYAFLQWAFDDDVRIREDHALMRVTRSQLAIVEQDLAALHRPPRAKADRRDRALDCYDDSGSPGQPWVGRVWRVNP